MLPLTDLTDLTDQITLFHVAGAGIPIALIGAVFLALGAQFQHKGVERMEQLRGQQTAGLSVRSLLALLARPAWVIGTVMLGLAILFQLTSLTLSPILVVQPVGALALVITAILNARLTKTRTGSQVDPGDRHVRRRGGDLRHHRRAVRAVAAHHRTAAEHRADPARRRARDLRRAVRDAAQAHRRDVLHLRRRRAVRLRRDAREGRHRPDQDAAHHHRYAEQRRVAADRLHRRGHRRGAARQLLRADRVRFGATRSRRRWPHGDRSARGGGHRHRRARRGRARAALGRSSRS